MKTMVSTAAGAQVVVPLEVPDGLLPGVKAGPWIVERELGRGGMGAVYAVVHEEIGKRAALKVVHARLLGPGFNADRMLLEAKVVNQVGHPNIVDIFETGKLVDGRPYIVMERLEGQPLSFRADEGKILPDQVISILLQVCDALIASHAAGVIHRDLKLDNVFLVDNADDPATPKVKLLDWGIAKVIDTASSTTKTVRHTIEGQLVGTPQYLSPEQARGADVSPQSDVYSLGVMAYELFLEQLPFEAETSAEIMAMHLRATPPPPRDLWPEIPAQLEALILSMMAKQPDHRPSMLEVARMLEAVRTDLDGRRHQQIDVVTIAPRATRHGSHAELARTEMAVAVPQRRWQYAVGVMALALSGLLFLLSRAGDSRAASAATVSSPAYTRTDTTLDHELALQRAAQRAQRPAAEPTMPREAAAQIDYAIPEPLVTEEVADPAPVPTQATKPRASSRKPPATPRRGPTKIVDPDGTIESY
ncbi:MAG: serine/threonine protein kinase [Myxococcota bacterium]|nr:serine/threonine protein kinase [Myxococcota bacterium]